MMMSIASLSVLAVWRITLAIVDHGEEGPFEILTKYRSAVARLRDSWFSRGLLCFWCMSFWVALPFALALAHIFNERYDFIVIFWPGLSGGAIALQNFLTSRPPKR